MRILHVIGSMNCGGAEAMIMSIYRNIDKKHIQFDFVVHSQEEAFYDKEIKAMGGRIYTCPRYTGINHQNYINWWNTFFKKYDEYKIIHGHIGSVAAIYLSIAKKYGLYTIAHSHNTDMSLIYRIYSYPTRYIADYFFSCSNAAGLKRYGKKITENKDKYKVINNAIDTNRFLFSFFIRNEVRRELFLNDNDVVVGTVGRLTEQKNPYGTIEIVDCLCKKNKNIKFLWIGTGPMEEQIKKKICEKKLDKCVLMLGLRSDVYRLLQSMDAFILPSFYEGLPVVGIEAQASGLRCYFSDSVTKETDITGRCKFLPLDDTNRWVNSILSDNLEHICTKDNIVKAGYDVHNTAVMLKDFYLSR